MIVAPRGDTFLYGDDRFRYIFRRVDALPDNAPQFLLQPASWLRLFSGHGSSFLLCTMEAIDASTRSPAVLSGARLHTSEKTPNDLDTISSTRSARYVVCPRIHIVSGFYGSRSISPVRRNTPCHPCGYSDLCTGLWSICRRNVHKTHCLIAWPRLASAARFDAFPYPFLPVDPEYTAPAQIHPYQ